MPSPPLPPTARDFLAYQRIVIDQASTRQVAKDLEISQTRVRQIVRRATDWLLQNLPPVDENQQPARLQLAQHIAADRLDRYLREADQAWQQTQETKYANLVLRLLTAQSKLPAFPGTLEALAMDAILGPLPDEDLTTPTRSVSEGNAVTTPHGAEAVIDQTAASSLILPPSSLPPSPPPPRDCSPNSEEFPQVLPSNNYSATLTPVATPPSDTGPDPNNAARSAFLSPAHPSSSRHTPRAEVPAIANIQITPQSLGFSTHEQKHSTRRDRRRLKRLTSTK